MPMERNLGITKKKNVVPLATNKYLSGLYDRNQIFLSSWLPSRGEIFLQDKTKPQLCTQEFDPLSDNTAREFTLFIVRHDNVLRSRCFQGTLKIK